MKRMSWRGLAAALCLGLTPGAGSALVISELFYDALGADDGLSFVELYGAPGTGLDGLLVEGVNGANGAVTHSLALTGAIPGDGVFVLADDQAGAATLVAGADLVLNFDFQNGPDSVVLRSGDTVLDALGYGVFAPGDVFAGSGNPAPDAATTSRTSSCSPRPPRAARHWPTCRSPERRCCWRVASRSSPGAAAARGRTRSARTECRRRRLPAHHSRPAARSPGAPPRRAGAPTPGHREAGAPLCSRGDPAGALRRRFRTAMEKPIRASMTVRCARSRFPADSSRASGRQVGSGGEESPASFRAGGAAER
jgi:hypothetical protein